MITFFTAAVLVVAIGAGTLSCQVLETKSVISKNGKTELFADVQRCGALKIGATIRDSSGTTLGSICQDGIEPIPPTSFTALTNSDLPDFLLITKVGAKSIEATVLSPLRSRYRESGSWSGWSVEPVETAGMHGLAIKERQDSLTLFYRWNGSSFRPTVRSDLPVTRAELEQLQDLIHDNRPLPPYVLVDACQKLVIGLASAMNVGRAIELCQQAQGELSTSSRIVSGKAGSTLSDQERETAIRQIGEIIAKAEKSNISK